MTIKFTEMKRIYDDQPVFGAAKGNFTFVITEDEPGKYTASAKVAGAIPFDGTRHDLGGYCAHGSFLSAVDACKEFYRAHSN